MAELEPTRAVIARSPQGRVLMVRRRDQGWSWPSSDECGHRVGDVPAEFAPRLTDNHSGWGWFDPEEARDLTSAEKEEPEPEIDPRLAKVLADNVEALGARMALFDTFERLEQLIVIRPWRKVEAVPKDGHDW
jgi:hypothetical protein